MPPKKSKKFAYFNEVKPGKSLWGGFSDPTYVSTDPSSEKTDLYVKQEPIPSRYLGQNFKVPRAKQGRTADTFFGGKFLTLASKEQNKGKDVDEYMDPGRADRKAAAESKKKNIDPKDFKFASYPKKSTGPGSIVGTFTTKNWEHLPDYKVTMRDEVPDRPKPQPRNILTKPSKKGTYGFPNTTLMGIPLAPVTDKDKKPVTDDYEAMRKRDREAWEKSKSKRLGGIFKLAGKGKTTFDEIPSVGVSSVFKEAVLKEEKKKKTKNKKKKPAPEPKPISDKPFRYSNPPKKGAPGFLGKYPNTRDDPKVPKEDPYDTLRLRRKEDLKKAPKPLGGVWKPTSGLKTAVVRSLLKTYY